MSATQMAWACFGQWLEIATQQSNGDISGVDLSTWAKWYGEGLDPVQAASRYRVGADPDDTPADLKALGWDRYTFISVHRGDMRAIASALEEARRLLERGGRYSWLDAPASLARDYAETGANDEQG